MEVPDTWGHPPPVSYTHLDVYKRQTGSFDGMQSPATLAQVRQGVATGVRGPAIGDLTVSLAPGGSITGTLSLTAEQIESLRKGKLYVQIGNEKTPDGNLWGWLLR